VLSDFFKNHVMMSFQRRQEIKLTLHPVIDDLLRLLGRALREPVVTQQHCDLVGVHQLPRHEGQRAKWHLLMVQLGGVGSRTKEK